MADQKNGFFGKSKSNSPMEDEDQAFLSQIEENIRSAGSEQMDAQKEAEHRAREMERIRNASAHIRVPGVKTATPAAGQPSQAPAPKANPLENDPRYREYFERLRKQKGEQAPPSPPAAPGPASAASSAPTASAPARPAAGAAQKIGPGSIVRFDDGSIGVYKDAVSGRDYALFYFLNPAGAFVPEGVFLQCYQARAIGQLPEEYFAQLRDDGTWNRDMILYHLARYEFVKELNALAEHQSRKPAATGATPEAGTPSQPAASPEPAADPAPASAPADNQPAPEAENPEGLFKGRRFQINFGGKQWDAVYWDADDENSIVAHNTHGAWSLMRLDLNRFKESLELLDRVDDATLEEIAIQAAGGA